MLLNCSSNQTFFFKSGLIMPKLRASKRKTQLSTTGQRKEEEEPKDLESDEEVSEVHISSKECGGSSICIHAKQKVDAKIVVERVSVPMDD
jgi:hypothetical protein